MNLNDLVSDPAWLFDLGFSVRKWQGGEEDPESPESWKLGEAYRLPSLMELSIREPASTTSMAWSKHAILMEIDIQHTLAMSSPSANVLLDFYMDTRCSRGIHRANANCHFFQFRWRKDFFTTVTNELMWGRPMYISRAKVNAGYQNSEQVRGWLTSTAKRLILKIRIPYVSLHGCDPNEFPEWSVMWIASDGRRRYSLARNPSSMPPDDPSLWCIARLVES